jgi:hypothetical protein
MINSLSAGQVPIMLEKDHNAGESCNLFTASIKNSAEKAIKIFFEMYDEEVYDEYSMSAFSRI